ncbi:OadG family protein [Gynuella sp.]|uniref:OadG family protein n=1 Tax=Gynuella sp. TaxID=2969146 RepID=UPI003D14D9F6
MSDNMVDGLYLMLLGMGTVFVFLGILVVGTTIMSRLVKSMSLPEEKKPVARAQPASSQTEIAIVAAAARAYHDSQ